MNGEIRMTKEELEKEAGEWLKSNIKTEKREGIAFNIVPTPVQIYCAGAEPREKQIQIDAEQIRALQKQNGELTDNVKELEAQIEGMKRYLDCEYCEHYTQRSGCKNCNEEIRSDWKLKEIKEK